jgi:hypothetical protein
MKSWCLAIVVLGAVVTCACAPRTGGLRPDALRMAPDVAASKGQSILEAIYHRNRDLQSFGGRGTLTLQQKNRVLFDGRAAWVGAVPDKLSLALLVGGQPVLRLASDGEYLYLAGTWEGRFRYHRHRTSRADLERLVGVDVQVSEIVALLAGRLPWPAYDTLVLKPWQAEADGNPGEGAEAAVESKAFAARTPSTGWELVFERKWLGARQKAILTGPEPKIHSVTRIDDGALHYHATVTRWQTIDGYTVPRELYLTGGEAVQCRLRIDGYTANWQPPATAFKISPPEEGIDQSHRPEKDSSR